MPQRRGRPQRIALWVIIGAVTVLLLAVAAIAVPMLTSENRGASGQQRPDGFVTQVQAHGDDGRTRTLTVSRADGGEPDLAQLRPGEVLRVTGAGFDASAGIYVAICRIPDNAGERPSPCLGGIPDDAQEESGPVDADNVLETVWITDHWAWAPFASQGYLDHDEGTFETQLLVAYPEGEELNCLTDACAVYTRADHTAMQDRVQDMFLPVAFAR